MNMHEIDKNGLELMNIHEIDKNGLELIICMKSTRMDWN